tara:strand:- start:3317 stop:3472 length:156 start_codon:yes stop_codon:yes gene_type:complete
MIHKIQKTIFGTYRVLWKANDGIRAGHEDFNTEIEANNFAKKLTDDWNYTV